MSDQRTPEEVFAHHGQVLGAGDIEGIVSDYSDDAIPGLTKAYTHNGYFKSLLSIVHFYNTRDVAAWPDPEVAMNVNTTEMGHLRLTRNQEKAIVAFVKTLSDGYMPASSH